MTGHLSGSNVLPGFEGVSRFYDSAKKVWVAKVKPGEFYVSKVDDPITTTLGSCVAACVRDSRRGVGGMNHFMLPASEGGRWGNSTVNGSARFGNFAMEHLINSIFTYGGQRADLEVKIFGGASVLGIHSTVGDDNVRFIEAFLKKEGYRVLASDTGGVAPRKLMYFPVSGKALVKPLALEQASLEAIVREEEKHSRSLAQPSAYSGSVELF